MKKFKWSLNKYKYSTKQLSLYEKANFFATYILAVTAILGFIISINSSYETSKNLRLLEENLSNFTQPILFFSDYNWLYKNDLDCSNPPYGINVIYKNGSNIPIIITNAEIKIYLNETQLNPSQQIDSTSLFYGIVESIVSVGETFSTTQLDTLRFSTIINNSASFLRINFSATISNINGLNKYRINLIHYIGIDCSNMFSKNYSTIKESLKIVNREY